MDADLRRFQGLGKSGKKVDFLGKSVVVPRQQAFGLGPGEIDGVISWGKCEKVAVKMEFLLDKSPR